LFGAQLPPELAGFRLSGVALDMVGTPEPDLLVSSEDLTLVVEGVGDGSFALGAPLAVSPAPVPPWHVPAHRDVDGDGYQDLFMLEEDRAALWFGSGNGSFSTYSLSSARAAKDAAFGDINGDGLIDLALVYESEIELHLGAGGRDFATTSALPVDAKVHSIECADMNGDGLDDLVLASWNDLYVLYSSK